jgi:hypothetical protein
MGVSISWHNASLSFAKNGDIAELLARAAEHAKRVLAKVLPVGTPFRRFQANDRLLAFLESL